MSCRTWKCVPKAIPSGVVCTWVSLVMFSDVFSVRVTKLLWGLVSHELTTYLSVFNLFLTQWIMVILWKGCKPHNFYHNCLSFVCCLSWTLGSSLKCNQVNLVVAVQPCMGWIPIKKKVFSIGITLVDVHLNWLNRFYFAVLEGGLLVILINCMIFLSPFLDVTKMPMSSFFPRRARLSNSLPIECFPLTYDLSYFKSRINRDLLTVGSFLYASTFLHFFVL